MDQIRAKRIYYVNSENLLTSTNSSFSVPLQIPDYDQYNRIALLQCNIPVTYYLVQQGQNTFTISENGSIFIITIPVGNYSINSFANIVIPLINSASPGHYTYTATYNNSFTQQTNGLYTFTVTTLLPVSFIFSSSNTINEQFGFNNGSTVTFTPGITTSTLVSTNVVSFIPESSLFIHCNLVDSGATDILQEIYSGNTIAFSNIVFTNPDPLAFSKALTSSRNKSVSFSITNQHNVPIYLNGINMLLTIVLYRDNDYYKKSEQFMKYQLQKEIQSENQTDEKYDNENMKLF